MRMRMLSAALMAAAPLVATAQSVVFTNGNLTIPLKPNTQVNFAANGNLQAECVLDGAHCQGVGSAPNANAATAALARNDNIAAPSAGQAIQLAWSSTNADLCRASAVGPGTTTWSGLRAGSGSESITLPQQGNYSFSISCYGLGGGQTKSVAVAVAAGSVDPDPVPADCASLAGDPLYQPPGWTRVQKTWVQTFSAPNGNPASPGYPSAVKFPTPVGTSKGTYLVVPFTPNPNESVNLYFDQIQSGPPGQSYTVRPADAMFVGISPCAGDLRPWVEGASQDPFLQHGCRRFENSASLIFSSKLAQSDAAGCKVEAGKTYYLHIMPADPREGLLPGEHSCANVPNSAIGCDVGIMSQVSHKQ